MADIKLFLGILMYLIFVSVIIGYSATSIGMNSGVPDVSGISANPDIPEVSNVPIIGGILSGVEAISTILSMVALVIVWNVPETIFPLWANILFIKPAVIALILIIVDVLLP